MIYKKYYLYKEQVSLDNGVTWEDVTPAVTRPDGDPIASYSTYDECTGGTPEIQYRWTQSGTTCIGYDKYQNNIKEQSTDGGSTWTVVIPEEYSASTLIETDSPDCGYVPPTPTACTCDAFAFEGTSEGNNVYRIEISSGETAVTAATWDTSCGLVPQGFTHTDDAGFQEIVTGGSWAFDNNIIRFTASTNPTSSVREGYMTITYTVDGVSCEKKTHLVQAAGPTFEGKYKLILNDSSVVTAACDSSSAITYSEITGYSGTVVSAEVGKCVNTIDVRCFWGCRSLSSIIISDSVTSIGRYVFLGCSGLTNVTVDSNNAVYDSRNNCNAIIETNTNTLKFGCKNTVIPNDIITIGDEAFDSTRITGITIPSSVTTIGHGAFAECKDLINLTIPDTVTSIGYEAFMRCGNLTNVTIGTGLTSISDWTFQACGSLTSITIPNSVTSIGRDCFSQCSSLSEITIPSSVTSIGYSAFGICTNLTSFICLATTPPTLEPDVFVSSAIANGSGTIYVPSASVWSYKSASGWRTYSSRIQPIS